MTQEQHEVLSRRPANPRAMPVADLARLLSAVGGHSVTPEMIEADVVMGAPTNADGTIDLVHYCAWLVKEMSARGS
jgi:hypothetical protein